MLRVVTVDELARAIVLASLTAAGGAVWIAARRRRSDGLAMTHTLARLPHELAGRLAAATGDLRSVVVDNHLPDRSAPTQEHR